MNAADLAIGLVIALSVAIGLVRGFVVEVMSLVVWVAAIVLARLFGGTVAQWFLQAVDLASARLVLGYAIVFVLVLVGGAVLVYLLRRMVQSTGLSGTDRLLGMVFGLARGAAIVVLVVLLLGLTPFPRDAWWRESRALPPFQLLAVALASWLPASLREKLDYSGGPATQAPPETKLEVAA